MVSIRAVDLATEFCTDTGGSSPSYAGRCYQITPTTDGAARVRLWALSSELNGIGESNLSVYRYTGSSTWTELIDNRATGNDGGSYSYAEGDTLGFSAFLLGETNSVPTALHLQSFSVQSGTNLLLLLAFCGLLLVSVGLLTWWLRNI
jgi:hypothetical protein